MDALRKELNGKGLGKVSYAYYRHWNGDNPKNKPDSIYVFIGISLKEKVNEASAIYPSPSSTYKSACGMVSMFRTNSFKQHLSRKEFFALNNLFANYRGFTKETYDVNGKIYHSFDELLKNASSGSNEEKLVNKIAEGNLRGRCVVLDLLKRNMEGEIKLSKTDVNILKASVFTEEEFSKTGQELEDWVD